jgi:hypothetical protein
MLKVTMVHLTRQRKYEGAVRLKKRLELFNRQDKADQIKVPASGKFVTEFVDLNDLAFWIATSKASWWHGGRICVDLEWYKALPLGTRKNLLKKAQTIFTKRCPEEVLWAR